MLVLTRNDKNDKNFPGASKTHMIDNVTGEVFAVDVLDIQVAEVNGKEIKTVKIGFLDDNKRFTFIREEVVRRDNIDIYSIQRDYQEALANEQHSPEEDFTTLPMVSDELAEIINRDVNELESRSA